MSFAGQGVVVAQPSEEPAGTTLAGTGSGEQSGVGGLLGGIPGNR